ncbi:helix-turn-helix domain-containing protein [Alteribacillus bidgolensis]|uniref:AraC-type DNA-binding protein n=1 Tax=Alteribacillus bidgolensis TaxID=930129 RepID=A0A1G8HC40_9BACI|nr:AraC family transcriptional regulator [Alteribacillus bidgolensis]SDI04169.1 AraC-type DNA-binding protein [Alteribacillus bidgolensis]
MTDQYPEIGEVVVYIHQHIHEPLELSALAAQAAYSPYHFNRIFKEKMGIPPLYYVSALRMQKAKDLLLHTNLSVRDVGLEIGQQSLGTFTTQFTKRIGMTPSQFRNSIPQANNHFHSLQKLRDWTAASNSTGKHTNITGTIQAAVPFEGVILIGLFAKPIPEGFPLHGTLISSLGDFCIPDVKPGIYYIMATSVSWKMKAEDFLLPHKTLRTRSRKPIIVEPFSPIPHQEVHLYPPRVDDPPILISLPLLMNKFLQRIHQHSNS